MKKKTVKEVIIHIFLVYSYKSQDFAQSNRNFARSHDRMTVTFRNSVQHLLISLARGLRYFHYVELLCPFDEFQRNLIFNREHTKQKHHF